MLMAMRVEIEGLDPVIVYVDLVSDKVYCTDGSEAEELVRDKILAEIRGQQEASMPILPHEQIYEVMNTERKIQEENNKHIFRRNG